nr:MAG TPA: hypothetical protein [Caudoviricetes sp.]
MLSKYSVTVYDIFTSFFQTATVLPINSKK